MSLMSAAERFAALDRSTVSFDAEHCLHSRERFAECEACVRICPVEAILPGKPPVLDVDKCVHCLACLPVCPTGSFHAKDSLPSLLNAITRIEGRQVELVCGHNQHPDRLTTPQSSGFLLPDCLAGMGTGGYVALAALDLEAVIVRLDACQECPWGGLRPEIETQVELARRLLAPWQKEDLVRCVDEACEVNEAPLLDIENPPLTRRDLFRLAARQGQVAVARAMELEVVPGKNQPGLDRQRLLGALQHLPGRSSTADPQLVGGNFALVSVSGACNTCGACARACPTSAIRFSLDETKQTFLLDFIPSLCVGCEMCIHVCEPGAVTVSHDPPFSAVFASPEPVTLLEGRFARCERCKAVFPARAGARLCSVCEYRSKNPFGSRMPPGFRKAAPKQGAEAEQ